MNGLLDIIFFAIVAVFILMRLRNVLGQKTDEDDKRRQEKYRKYQDNREASAKVVDFPGTKKTAAASNSFEDMKVVSPNIATGVDAKVMEVVHAVTATDKGFTLAWFMTGAKKAFEMVVEAFAKGDEKTLSDLLTKEVLQTFKAELKTQAEAKRKQDITLVSILDCSVIDAEVKNNVASFTVKFVSEQIRVTRDTETGAIIEGNAAQIDRVEDSWTFTRPIRTSSPNWQLAAVSA